MMTIGLRQASLAKFAAPGRWNDPDMLEEVWTKPLAGGAIAVGLFKRDAVVDPITVTLKELSIKAP
jgi:hypothetical protein